MRPEVVKARDFGERKRPGLAQILSQALVEGPGRALGWTSSPAHHTTCERESVEAAISAVSPGFGSRAMHAMNVPVACRNNE
jgi:hypothetical protein